MSQSFKVAVPDAKVSVFIEQFRPAGHLDDNPAFLGAEFVCAAKQQGTPESTKAYTDLLGPNFPEFDSGSMACNIPPTRTTGS